MAATIMLKFLYDIILFLHLCFASSIAIYFYSCVPILELEKPCTVYFVTLLVN